VLAAAPGAATAHGTAGCGSAQLRLAVRAARNSGGTWLGAALANRGPACRLSARDAVRFLVVVGGRRAPVVGNGLTLHPGGVLLRGRPRLVAVQWSNWCGRRSRISVLVSFRGRVTPKALRILPRCLSRSRPSRLAAVP
jgi:hypothetical protein